MKKIYVSLDVGGTNSRLGIEIWKDYRISSYTKKYNTINSITDLKEFIFSSLNTDTIDGCVIGFAGAIIDNNKVEMTNWPNLPVITLDDLIGWGFPKNKTIMVNDMELAAYGLIDLEEKKQIPSKICEIIYKPKKKSRNKVNNKLVIAPGTGFGTASVIDIKTHSEESRIKEVLSSEIQHIQIPSLNERHAKLIKIIHSHKPNRKFMNFEDFVSGKGLMDTYKAILFLEGIEQEIEKNASEIAELAVQGKDKFAKESLDIFYKCTGRLVQAMALMIQPYGGIFLCGASTKHNKNFIMQSNFMNEMHNCLIRKQLLEQFPVYIITEADINLLGGLWACRNIL